MENSIDIKEYLLMIKRRKWIVLIIVLLSMGVGALLVFKDKASYVPIYQAYTRIRINTAKSAEDQMFSPQTTALNQNISNTYLNLIKSKNTMEDVIKTLDLKMKPEQLSSMVNAVADENNTEFISITVTGSDKKMIQEIANILPSAYNRELIKTINLDCVQVIDLAEEPKFPLSAQSNSISKIVKFGVVGIVVSIFVVLLLEYLNNKIITPQDVEEYWELPILGVVPYEEKKEYKKNKRKTRRYKRNKKNKLEVN